MRARVRIRSWRPKGSELRVMLLDRPGRARSAVEAEVCAALDAMDEKELAGFAFVAWHADHGSVAAGRAYSGSSIPPILVPTFVRDRLLAERIEMWTIRRIEEG